MVCGDDLCYDIEIMLEEVVKGCKKDICILILVECDICYGIGVEKDFKVEICLYCYGFGWICC